MATQGLNGIDLSLVVGALSNVLNEAVLDTRTSETAGTNIVMRNGGQAAARAIGACILTGHQGPGQPFVDQRGVSAVSLAVLGFMVLLAMLALMRSAAR